MKFVLGFRYLLNVYIVVLLLNFSHGHTNVHNDLNMRFVCKLNVRLRSTTHSSTGMNDSNALNHLSPKRMEENKNMSSNQILKKKLTDQPQDSVKQTFKELKHVQKYNRHASHVSYHYKNTQFTQNSSHKRRRVCSTLYLKCGTQNEVII